MKASCSVCVNPLPAGTYDQDRPHYCRRRCMQVARVLTNGAEAPVRDAVTGKLVPGSGLTVEEAVQMGSKWIKRWGTSRMAYSRAKGRS